MKDTAKIVQRFDKRGTISPSEIHKLTPKTFSRLLSDEAIVLKGKLPKILSAMKKSTGTLPLDSIPTSDFTHRLEKLLPSKIMTGQATVNCDRCARKRFDGGQDDDDEVDAEEAEEDEGEAEREYDFYSQFIHDSNFCIDRYADCMAVKMLGYGIKPQAVFKLIIDCKNDWKPSQEDFIAWQSGELPELESGELPELEDEE